MTEKQKADYWDKRIREIFDSNAKQKRIKKIYRMAYDKVEADILKLFEKLEEGQELTETELYQFDRFVQLQKGIKAQCTDAGKELNAEVYSRLNEAYKSTFDAAKEVYDLPGTWGVQNKKMAEQCIKTVWSGMHFSERIWRNARNKLAPKIERHVIDCVIGGRSKDECIKEIKRDFDVGFNDADRLVRTEVMNVINRAQCETYASEGIKKVKWITGRDNRMCEHCGSLEGKVFELRANGTLINPETSISQPVIVHPRCRCTIIPIVEFAEKELTNGVNGGIIEMYREGTALIDVEPMPLEQFLKIQKRFERNGGVFRADSESNNYVVARGKEAITFNENTVLFRYNPSRAAVFEELIHTYQYKTGKLDGSDLSRCLCEIEAKEKLLKYSKAYGLTKKEIEITEQLLALDKQDLIRLTGDG